MSDERRLAGRLSAGIVILIAALTLGQHALQADFGIDQFLVREAPDGAGSSMPGRMAWATATNFLFVGLALLTLEWQTGKGWRPAFALALVPALIGLLAFAGYLYGADSLHTFPSSSSSMAVHTALCFVLLATGILCARPGPGPLQILTSEGTGGKLARRLLPFAIVIPLIMGWLRLRGEQAGLYGFEFGLALFAVSNVLGFSMLIWLTALWLNRSDAAQRESERSLRELIESLPQLVWTCQADGPCNYLSPQWVAYTGLPEATQLGYGWLEQIHPDDRERTIARWKETAGIGHAFDIDFRIRRHDGVYRWFKTQAKPLRDPNGRIVKWFGSNTDIDDRKQAEEKLAASTREVHDLKAALDEHAIVAVTDRQGKITSVNDKFCALSQYTRPELIGQDHRFINSPHHSTAIIQDPWAAITKGRVWQGEIKNRAKDGSFYWVDTTIVPFLSAHGEPRHYVAISADITARKEAQEALAQLNQELEKRVEARTREVSVANTALRKTASQLHAAQRISHVGSWELEVATGRVEWSEELYRITGLDPASPPPHYSRQAGMFSPESWARISEVVAHAVATGEGYEVLIEIIRPDGDLRWAIARAQATRGPDGDVALLSGTLQDVTELRRAQAELERALERIRLAARAGELGIWEWSIADNRLVWDETMYRLYGIAPERFSGAYDAWCSAVHPEDRLAAETALNEAVAGGADFDPVFRIIRPDGSVRHIQACALVRRDATGKALHVVGINTDTTAQREAVLALRANEALLREFVAHAPAAIAMLDRDVRYIQASDRWLTDYKLGGQDIIGRSHYEVFPDIPERWKQVHQRVLAGAVEFCEEDPFPRADGSTEWLQWEARPWRQGDGSVGGLIFFTQVITARKQLELDLIRQKQLLQNSNRDLAQFAYVASHDLQEPLRAVAGCAQILQRRYADKLDEPANELIGHLVDGARRMQTLVLDLLTYSKVGTQRKDSAPIDSAAILQQALANLQTAIKESHATVSAGPLPPVSVDPAQLSQLFQNMVGNALKYRGPRLPEIRVEAKRQDQMWEFSIRDNGIGIESKYFERIFVLFQRLHTRVEYPGTGIGLALCKKIVERYGGRIWVESTLGEGSVFYFTIPASV